MTAGRSETLDFRLHLQRELMERCKSRPGYSLRTFAKALQIDATALSKILAGKRSLTKSMVRKLAGRLGLSPIEISRFLNEKDAPPESPAVDRPYLEIAQDTFEAIGNWYYLAILELTYLPTFVGDSRWIAKTLGISPIEASLAIEALFRLGFLAKDETGKWQDRYAFFTANHHDYSTVAARRFQKQLLQKAIVALEEVPVTRRSQTGITFSGDSKLIGEAKLKIQAFMRDLTDFMQSSQQPAEVYQLSISLFPLTKLAEG